MPRHDIVEKFNIKNYKYYKWKSMLTKKKFYLAS